MSNKKNPGLTRRASGLMALEQRFMFDGAAVADAVDTAIDLQIAAPAALAPSESLARAEARAEQLVTDFLKRPDAREQLFALFKGAQTGEQATPEWQAAVDQLLAQAEQGDLNVRVELRSAAELQGAKGAFSATGTTGEATIYLNADWVATADSESVAIVLTEELGHYLDHAINGDADTPGDEGQVFAQFVVNGTQPLPVSFDLTDNDHAILSLDGQQVLAELASFNFVNAYEMVYDLDNDSTADGSGNITGGEDNTERWASKEQNLHYFNATTPLGIVSINDGTNGQNFSGNDVSAIAVVINGTTHYGWISRPIKANGVVRGFYFWTDTRFTSLALAQADGNRDLDGTLNNRGFVFVVDQTWFNSQITSTAEDYNGTPKPLINNVKDGNLGNITVANVGSSSDRVDSALNSVNSPVVNAAPTAVADSATGTPSTTLSTGVGNAALEQGLNTNPNPDVVITASINGSGNVLSNDTDTNSDTLSVTTVSSKYTGTSATASSSGMNVVGQYGTLNIKSDGSWTYTPDNTNPSVNALLTGNLQEQFTYTASDGKGGTASATLTVQINGSNDAPVAADDYNIAKESTTTATTTTAITGFNATGNVLPNDTDVDAGDTKTLVGLSDTGSASAGTYNSNGASTLLTFTTNSNIGSVSLNSQIFWDHNGDGDGASATTPVALAVSNGAATPTYTPVTVISKADGDTTGTTDIGLSATPTHYWNGTGWTAFTNIESQLTSGSRYFEFGAANGNVAANSAKGGVLVVGGAEVTVAINIINITGAIYEGMTVSASNGGISVLPADTVVSKVNYDANGDITSIELSNDFNPKPNDPTGYSLTFGMPSSGNISITTGYGRLELSTTGDYTYTPHTDNILISDGESLVEEFNYTMRDTAGATSSAKLYITVYGSGTNDPNLSADDITAYESGVGRNSTAPYTLTSDNTVFNGVNPTATGVLANDTTGAGGVVASYTKADGTNLTTAGNSLTGTYGALNIASNGTYSFTVDNANATVQALLPGSTLTETFIYKVTNSAGGASFAKLNVTIEGTNDLPDAVADDAAVSEDGILNATGNVLINDTDVDAGDSKVVSRAGTSSANSTVTSGTTLANGLNVAGTYGTLTLGADGTYSYALNNASANVQNLAHGEVVNDVFTYEVKDANGATSTTTLTVSVTGANEAPVNQFNGLAISSTVPTAVTTAANTALNFTGSETLSVTDVDSNLSTITLEVEHGVLSFTETPSVVTLSSNTGKTITISAGTQAELNAALARLRYTPDTNFYGTDFLSINSADTNSARDIDGIAINIPTVTSVTVSEPALSSGTNSASTAETATGNVTLASGQTIQAQQTGDLVDGDNNVIGTWQVETDGDYTITLTTGSNIGSSNFSYVVYDTFGNAINNTVVVTITDDTPTASADTASVNEGSSITGNVLNDGTADIFGADGPKVTTPTGGVVGVRAANGDNTTAVTNGLGSTIVGQYGSLTLTADGNYSYSANANSVSSAQNDVFVYTIEDADGSRSTATLTLTVNDVVVNNGALSVNNIGVNEGASHAVFTVSGAANTAVQLTLNPGTATGGGVDFGALSTVTTLSFSNLEYSIDAGTTWVRYTSTPQIPASGQLLVRTPIVNDTVFDNGETFTLTAREVDVNLSGLGVYNVNYQPISLSAMTRVTGSEGAVGAVYQKLNAIMIDGQAIDARITIQAKSNVSSFTFDNDDSNAARFQPEINSNSASGSYVDLTIDFYLGGTNTKAGLYNFYVTGVDVDGASSTVREFVELNGFSQQITDIGTELTVTPEFRSGFTRFLGRDDSLSGITFDNTASFVTDYRSPVDTFDFRMGVTGSASTARLFSMAFGNALGTFTNAQTTSDSAIEAIGTATIYDDGTGLGGTNDDRTLTVAGGLVFNEASPYATFTVTGVPGYAVNLALGNDSDSTTADATISGFNFQYSTNGGSSWTTYSWNGISGDRPTVPNSGSILVRVDIASEQDNPAVFEGAETFTLTASYATNSTITSTAANTITDDGTGRIDLNGDGDITDPNEGQGPGAGFDDDRTLTINSPLVNEASDYAVFTLTGNSGQTVSLQLQDESNNGAVTGKANILENQTLKIWDGLAWVDYDATNLPTFDANGKIFVQVDIRAEQDTVFEGPETFKLNATLTGRTTPVTGEATIIDDGTGVKFSGTFTSGLPTTDATDLDNDQTSTITVTGGIYNEGSPRAVFTVNATAGQSLTLDVLDEAETGKAPTGDDEDGADDSLNNAPIYYSLDGGSTWQLYTGTSIIAGSVPVLVAVDISQESDDVYEGEEQFKLLVTSGNQSAFAFGTIVDDGTGKISPAITVTYSSGTDPTADLGGTKDDDRPTFSVSPVKVSEGGKAFFTVTRNGASAVSQTVQVSTSLASGDTAEANDFTAITNQTLTFAAGVNTQTFFVQTAADGIYEGDETFTVTLSNPTPGSSISTTAGSAQGTIADDGTGTVFNDDGSINSNATKDDDRPSFSIADVSISEGGLMTFTVTRTGDAVATQTINFATSGGSAVSGTDFTANSGTLTFASGESTKTFTVQTTADGTYEGSETFTVTLSNSSAGSTISDDTATGTILDDGSGPGPYAPGTDAADDDRPTFSVSPVTVSEGGKAFFTVTRNGASAVSQTVQVSTSLATGDTAESNDFTAITNQTLTFAAGVNTQTFFVQTAADGVYEGDETFTVTLSNPTSGALISTTAGSAQGTIADDGTGTVFNDDGSINSNATKDDDRAITVSGLDDVSEGSNAIFTVTLPDGNTRATEISLALSTGTAEADDYSSNFTAYYYVGETKTALTINDGKIILPLGVTSFFVSVPTTQDTDFEGAEDFSLTATITGGKNGSDTSTILDDGTGRIYDDHGTNATGPGDDDRPKPAPVLPPPPAATPAAPSLTPITPTPVPDAPQSFSSALAPLAPALVPVDPPAPLGDTVTSRSGVPIPVSETAPPGLSLYQGVTDQFVQSTDVTSKVSLPFDAFIHSNKDAVIQLQAKQADDSPLPNWVQFDPATGVFEVTPPKDFKGKLDLKVIARDDDGREAVAIFQMFVGEQTTDKPQSRESFTEKLRMAGKRPITLMRVVDGSAPAPVREAPVVRAAAA